ncbi:BGTF surface domain-containing protein [Halorussus salinus]|uniref:BGTF surface domain-containing protein n=1 Tax=Halorussus salinus TaxID=1364935 RepID=UPI0010922D0F|nr:BGTF surface domain-containing protein [Halorussus salinus]
MSDTTLHRQVLVAALVLLAGVAGVATGTPVTVDDTSPPVQKIDTAVAQTDTTNESQNLTATVVHDENHLELSPTRGQNVSIRTNAAAGTKLTVELRENGMFTDQYDAMVSENGTATLSLDLRSLEPGTNVSLVVRHGQQTLTKASGIVTELSVTFVHEGDRLVVQQATDRTIRVETNAGVGTNLTIEAKSGGEFLKASGVTVAEDGMATGTFDFDDVTSGTEFTVSVRDGSRTLAETDGVILNESAMVTETTDAPTETTTDDTETTADETGTTTGGDSESGVPGFGVPVALLALVAGVALARRG